MTTPLDWAFGVTVVPGTGWPPCCTLDCPGDKGPGSGVGVGVMGVTGVIGDDVGDVPDVPPGPVALAVKVYAVPFVRPVTTHEVAGAVTVHVAPPGDAVMR